MVGIQENGVMVQTKRLRPGDIIVIGPVPRLVLVVACLIDERWCYSLSPYITLTLLDSGGLLQRDVWVNDIVMRIRR